MPKHHFFLDVHTAFSEMGGFDFDLSICDGYDSKNWYEKNPKNLDETTAKRNFDIFFSE